jgi:hypothetical protein
MVGAAIMETWQAVGIVVEGDPIDVGGLNPWAFAWRPVQDEPVELPHPAYPHQRHRMWVYEVEGDGRTVRFATGELSANVWGFYVPAG